MKHTPTVGFDRTVYVVAFTENATTGKRASVFDIPAQEPCDERVEKAMRKVSTARRILLSQLPVLFN